MNDVMGYESELHQFEEKINKGGTFSYSNIQEIDTIRRFALMTKTHPKSDYLLGKSRQLLLNYFERCFDDFKRKIKNKEIPTMEDDREKMRLFYLEMAIKGDEPQSLQELENEHQEIRMKIEELSQKVLGVF